MLIVLGVNHAFRKLSRRCFGRIQGSRPIGAPAERCARRCSHHGSDAKHLRVQGCALVGVQASALALTLEKSLRQEGASRFLFSHMDEAGSQAP